MDATIYSELTRYDMPPDRGYREDPYAVNNVVVASAGTFQDDLSVEELHANAYLIAAAPDLYEALWTAVEHNRMHFSDHHNTVLDGEKALRKARGEEEPR